MGKNLLSGECFGEFGLFCGEFRKKFSSHTVLDPVLELCPDQLKLGIWVTCKSVGLGFKSWLNSYHYTSRADCRVQTCTSALAVDTSPCHSASAAVRRAPLPLAHWRSARSFLVSRLLSARLKWVEADSRSSSQSQSTMLLFVSEIWKDDLNLTALLPVFKIRLTRLWLPEQNLIKQDQLG